MSSKAGTHVARAFPLSHIHGMGNRPNPIPVIVLGRLAIHQNHQDKGLGTALLRDAILRSPQAAEQVRAAAILVHAISARAKRV